MNLLQDQIASSKLDAIFKAKALDGSENVAPRQVVQIINSSSPGFSVQHLSLGILKYLKSIMAVKSVAPEDICTLIRIIIAKFSASFRPSPGDVLGLVRICHSAANESVLGDCFRLLTAALRNQFGNPKNAFLTVCEELIPLLNDMSVQVVNTNIDAIRSCLSIMFHAQANLSCLSAYLSSAAGSTLVTSRKRKSGGSDPYVSLLFQRLEGCRPQISCLVLGEYVARRRHSALSIESGDSKEETAFDEEFKFFTELVQRCHSVEARMQLWQCMNALKMYRLRGESGESHKSALKEFFSEVGGGNDENQKWHALEIVLSIDPVNFTDEVCETVWKLLRTMSTPSAEADACIRTLLRSFAVKGSLVDIIRQSLEVSFSEEKSNFFNHISLSQILPQVVLETAPIDLIQTVEALFDRIQDRPASIRFVIPILQRGFGNLPENLLSRASDLFSTQLEKLTSLFGAIKKSDRSIYAALMIALVDGLRMVNTAWSLPGDESSAKVVHVTENALSLIASKDASNRCCALLRLSCLCGFEVSVSDLTECRSFEDAISKFVDGHFLNAWALWDRYSRVEESEKLWKNIAPDQLCGAFPDSLIDNSHLPNTSIVEKEESSSDLDSLLERTNEIMKRFPRIIFTPPALRKSDFSPEIIALELAWSNHADKASIDHLLRDGIQKGSICLYAISLIFEETKRNKSKVSDLFSSSGELNSLVESALTVSHSLLAQTRFLLAVHGASSELDSRLSAELLAMTSIELLNGDKRDRPAVDCAYYALSEAITTGKDRKKIRLPWWTNKIVVLIMGIRGLLGSCISIPQNEDKVETAHYVVRLWKAILDGVSREKFHRVSKSIPVLIGEFMRLSGHISSADCLDVLERGCCILLDKLSESEKQFLHAMLGKNDRESLRRVNEMLEKNFKYKGKV